LPSGNSPSRPVAATDLRGRGPTTPGPRLTSRKARAVGPAAGRADGEAVRVSSRREAATGQLTTTGRPEATCDRPSVGLTSAGGEPHRIISLYSTARYFFISQSVSWT